MGCISSQPQNRYRPPQPPPPPQHIRMPPIMQPQNYNAPIFPPPQRIHSPQAPRPFQSPTSPRMQPYITPTDPNVHQKRRKMLQQRFIGLHQPAFNPQQFSRRYGGQAVPCPPHKIHIKLPQNAQRTKFKYIEQALWIFPPSIFQVPFQVIRKSSFQQKMTWLRLHIQSMRVPWTQGCELIQVDRHNVLMSSYHALRSVNLRKQLKIRFDQQEVDDAGGLLRQWLHLCLKELCDSKLTGALQLCNTDQTAYKIVADPSQTQDQAYFKQMLMRMLGIVIGKGLFDRVPLNCYLTSSLWRQICGQQPVKSDFYNYDRQLYNCCKDIESMTNAEQIGLNFSYLVSVPNKGAIQVELKPGGKKLQVNDTNKAEYISLLTRYFCVQSCQHYVKVIRQQIMKIFPLKLLQIFEPYQMESMLNGPPNINVAEWRQSTEYKGYKKNDQQVKWFWEYVQNLPQEKLGNLLHYVTGSRRVPVLGFFYLQSNRNQLNRFTIQKVAYTKQNPYPKSHTCFNRLELPSYKDQAELNRRMDQLLLNEINSFGMS